MIHITEIFSLIICTLVDLQWINWFFMEKKCWKFLGKLINKKIPELFTILTLTFDSLNLSYLPRDPFDDITGDQLKSFLRNEILQEIIFLPLSHARSPQLDEELQNKKKADEVAIVFSRWTMKRKQKAIVLFGYQPKVIEVKQKFLQIIERNILHTYKFSPNDDFFVSLFIEYLLHFIFISFNISKEYMRLKKDTNHLG